jgi:hypothetical protein
VSETFVRMCDLQVVAEIIKLLKITRFYFQYTLGTRITVPKNLLNTLHFSSAKVTYSNCAIKLLKITRFYFQCTLGTGITVPENLLNTLQFSSAKVTYSNCDIPS